MGLLSVGWEVRSDNWTNRFYWTRRVTWANKWFRDFSFESQAILVVSQRITGALHLRHGLASELRFELGVDRLDALAAFFLCLIYRSETSTNVQAFSLVFFNEFLLFWIYSV